MDASASQHDEAVWSALRNTGTARKAGLHAHAMLCALEGGELVIPAPPGVSPVRENTCITSLPTETELIYTFCPDTLCQHNQVMQPAAHQWNFVPEPLWQHLLS